MKITNSKVCFDFFDSEKLIRCKNIT